MLEFWYIERGLLIHFNPGRPYTQWQHISRALSFLYVLDESPGCESRKTAVQKNIAVIRDYPFVFSPWRS